MLFAFCPAICDQHRLVELKCLSKTALNITVIDTDCTCHLTFLSKISDANYKQTINHFYLNVMQYWSQILCFKISACTSHYLHVRNHSLTVSQASPSLRVEGQCMSLMMRKTHQRV